MRPPACNHFMVSQVTVRPPGFDGLKDGGRHHYRHAEHPGLSQSSAIPFSPCFKLKSMLHDGELRNVIFTEYMICRYDRNAPLWSRARCTIGWSITSYNIGYMFNSRWARHLSYYLRALRHEQDAVEPLGGDSERIGGGECAAVGCQGAADVAPIGGVHTG